MGKLAQQLGGQSQVKVTGKTAEKKSKPMKKGGTCGCAKKKMKCGGKVKESY